MEFILLRILKGRLPLKRGGLSLYIEEPRQDCMYESMEIYKEIYDESYYNGIYTASEMNEFLKENEIWTDEHERELGRLKTDIDSLKLKAYKNFFFKKELNNTKHLIRSNEKKTLELSSKKTQLHYLTCEGIAEYARWNWIIDKNVYSADGKRYNYNEISLKSIVSFYEESVISSADFRAVARFGDWRSMWNLSKKTGDLFGVPAINLTRDQLLLTSFSAMYDMVYESPEAPIEDVINDDDCLDGWFVEQKQKMEQIKKEMQSKDGVPKTGGEVFKMVSSPEEAAEVYRMNSEESRMRLKSREREIKEKGIIKNDLEFSDVRRDIAIEQNKKFVETLRGKK